MRARPCASQGINSPILPKTSITIEELLHWAFAREKVHMARPAGMPGLPMMPPRGGRDSTAAIGGGGGGMNMGFEAPADAYAVMRAVDDLGGIAGLVREYALIGAPPDWTPHPVIRVRHGDTVNDSRTRKPSFCMFIYVGDLPEHVLQRRQRYARWAQGLAIVHASLADAGLQRYDLAPDLPPLAPWKITL
jgi:hypothetical protein